MAELDDLFDIHVRKHRAQIQNLKKALLKRNLIRNPERLDALFKTPPALSLSACPEQSDHQTFEWTYEFKNLALTLSGLRHPQPPGAVIRSGNGLLSGKVTEYFAPTRRGGADGIIPIKTVELNFIVEGDFNSDGEAHPLIACWHVDTHTTNTPAKPEKPDEADRQDNHALHPLFHYQFGGRKLRPSGPSVRGVLILDVPRIPIPPLDVNLAIDFVVSNYLGSNWKSLRNDTQYVSPVRESMRRIWAPYYSCISDHFTRGPRSKYALNFHPNFL